MDLLRKFGIALIALLAVGGTVASASDSGTSSEDATGSSQDSDSGSKETGESDEVDDVKISSCSLESLLNLPEATIKVTNNSEKASDYMIEITFQSKNGKEQFGTGDAFISNLKPGQSKTEKVTGLDEVNASTFTCEVSSVDRMESL
ncbi:MAG: hypothetical protein E6Q90_12760 [Actinobacteria bacterium]|nr:MAG: hypothetical protein E6Q90_12760 [Actinomycetota bacterium]